jgi:hypothetical protein
VVRERAIVEAYRAVSRGQAIVRDGLRLIILIATPPPKSMFGRIAIAINLKLRSAFDAVPLQVSYSLPRAEPFVNIPPDKDLARIQKIFSSVNGKPPRCRFLGCGHEIDYGYRTCETHRSVCCSCKKREPIISINGKLYCGYIGCASD